MSTLRVKQMLDLFGQTIKIGKKNAHYLMENERNGALAFFTGREMCFTLTPKTFNCTHEFDSIFSSHNDQSGLGHTWDDYTYAIPQMTDETKELYTTVCDHNRKIYDFGDSAALFYFQNRKEYSPKFAYEQGIFELTFLTCGFLDKEQQSNNLDEFIAKLPKYNNKVLQETINNVAEEYWTC